MNNHTQKSGIDLLNVSRGGTLNCAFGATLAKKFDGDPAFWRVIDGKLYFNTNGDIQATWLKDTSGNIVKANASWTQIKGTAVAAL